jgi:peptidoglycan hydrolase-like protein with peptidoglycan-binding domain
MVVLCARQLSADDRVRQVQEALRKRHLYFGDIDGRDNAELQNALKRYQERKGLSVSGDVDNDTAASLGLSVRVNATAVNRMLPDEPVLKSDFARELTAEQRVALERETDAEPLVSPPPPAESPAQVDNVTPERVTQFVESYLHDAESNDPAAQTKYYAFPLRYMGDGEVKDPQHVERDARKQIKKWPRRKFMLAGPVRFFSTGEPGEARVEFTYAFEEAQNDSAIAKGEARQDWTVRAHGDAMKITRIDEEILRHQ